MPRQMRRCADPSLKISQAHGGHVGRRASRWWEAQNVAFWPTYRQGASRVSGLEQRRYWRCAGGSSGVMCNLDEPRPQRFDADDRHPQGFEPGARWRFDRECFDNEDDGVVEVVVIPIPAHPRRVGRICVGAGHHPEQESDEKDDPKLLKHASSLPECSMWSRELYDSIRPDGEPQPKPTQAGQVSEGAARPPNSP